MHNRTNTLHSDWIYSNVMQRTPTPALALAAIQQNLGKTLISPLVCRLIIPIAKHLIVILMQTLTGIAHGVLLPLQFSQSFRGVAQHQRCTMRTFNGVARDPLTEGDSVSSSEDPSSVASPL